MQRIEQVTIKHLKGIKHLTVYAKDVNEFAGGCGAGKTTILDAMQWALGGATTHQKVPVREGEDEGSVELITTDYCIQKRFEAETGKVYLKIKGRKGGRFGQREIDPQLSSLTFDPTQFSNWDAKRQVGVVRQLAGEKWCAELLRIDGVIADLFDERAAANSVVKLMGVRTAPKQVFAADVAALLARRDAIQRFNDEQQASARAIEVAEATVQRRIDSVSTIETEIIEARKRLETLEGIKVMAQASVKVAEDEAKALPTPAEPQSFDEVDGEISGLEQQNAAAAEYVDWEKFDGRLKEATAAAAQLTEQLETARADRITHVATVVLPISGVEMKADGLWVNGRPFDQLSGGEQIRASTAIAIALNPELRVMFIQHGEALDDEFFQEILDMAFAASPPMQVWVATQDKTGEGHGDAIHIELGEVKTDAKTENRVDEPAMPADQGGVAPEVRAAE